MNALVELLPVALQSRAKALVAAVGMVLTVLSATLPDVPTWITITLGILTALSVHQVPAPGYVAPGDDT